MVDIQSAATENRQRKKKERKKKPIVAECNGQPYWVAIIKQWHGLLYSSKIYDQQSEQATSKDSAQHDKPRRV